MDNNKAPRNSNRPLNMSQLLKSSFRSPGPPQSQKNDTEDDAVQALQRLIGLSQQLIKASLYKCFILTDNHSDYQRTIDYFENTQAHAFKLKLIHIIRIVQNRKYEFKRGNRMMLWHGTPSTAAGSIIRNGFQTPALSNQMFGAGIYFADRVTKSAQYCSTSRQSGSKGCLLLCDVLLGKVYVSKKPKNNLTSPPSYQNKQGETVQCGSVRCMGEIIPDETGCEKVDGCYWPMGTSVNNRKFKEYTVRYNEYVVYDPDKVRIKFVVEFEFQ